MRTLGKNTLGFLKELGAVTLFLCFSFSLIFKRPFKWSRVVQQIYFVGVKSLFVVCLTALFTGMVLGLQGYYTLAMFGSEGLLGGAVSLSLIRELGPVLAALMVTGRAGSSIAAELGSMRISEQIDALDTMNINPIKFLVSPIIAASILSLPLLTAIFNGVGILGGYLSGVILLDVSGGMFINSMISSTSMKDVSCGLMKPLFFGFIIAGMSCYRGFYCHILKPGAQGAKSVSFATTSSVVFSSVIILVTDYVLTALFML